MTRVLLKPAGNSCKAQFDHKSIGPSDVSALYLKPLLCNITVYRALQWKPSRLFSTQNFGKPQNIAAKREKLNRSALVRQALREHLRRLSVLELEERDRRGYQVRPQRIEEYLPWEEIRALLLGRQTSESDTADRQYVAVVSQSFGPLLAGQNPWAVIFILPFMTAW